MTKIIHHSQAYLEIKKARIERKIKRCIGCKEEKDKSQFPTDRNHADLKYPYCNECCKERHRDLYKKQPEKFYATSLRWAKKNPEKIKAHAVIRNAVKTGKIKKPEICSHCGRRSSRIEAHHHNGYAEDRVLDVVWLCRPCHKKADMV